MSRPAPGDMEEIRGIVSRLDSATSPAVNELRIYRLRFSPAEDLAATLQTALMQNILPQGVGVVQQTGAGGAPGGLPFGGGPFGARHSAPSPERNSPRWEAAHLARRSAACVPGRLEVHRPTRPRRSRSASWSPGRTARSSPATWKMCTSRRTSGRTACSFPPRSRPLDLLEAVINNLDVPTAARSQVNIFTLKRADANLDRGPAQPALQRRPAHHRPAAWRAFRATARRAVRRGGSARLPAALDGDRCARRRGGADPAGDHGRRPQTNSIIVAASQNDLDAIRAIIARLEDAPRPAAGHPRSETAECRGGRRRRRPSELPDYVADCHQHRADADQLPGNHAEHRGGRRTDHQQPLDQRHPGSVCGSGRR